MDGQITSESRPSHGSKSQGRAGTERTNSKPIERPKENTSSWLAKDILNRSQHGLEGGDRSRDSRPLNRSQHGIEGGDRSRDSRPLNRSQHGIEGGDRSRDSRPLNRSQHGIERDNRSRDSRPLGSGSDGMGLAFGHQSVLIPPRPAGWLGHEISNRSFNDLNSALDREPDESRMEDPSRQMSKKKRSKDPGVRRDPADDQSFASESVTLQMMREKHRASEKRLHKAMSKGKLNGAQQRNLVNDGSIRISTSNAHW
jgi:hypothetical protein